MHPKKHKPCFSQLERWLELFIEQFDLHGQSARFCFNLKYEHSRKVAEESAELARTIGLAENEIELARIAGLLHDVGRFPQFAYYRTFNDRQSLDHGALGAAIVGDNSILSALDNSDRLVLESAVLHHNKPRLPEFLRHRCHLFAQIIRDADKLDIYRVMEQYRDDPRWLENFDLLDDGNASSDVLNALEEGRHIPYNSRRNQTDCTLMKIGWVFDMNFDHTLQQMVDRGHYDMLKSALPDSGRIKQALTCVDRYVGHRLERHRKNALCPGPDGRTAACMG